MLSTLLVLVTAVTPVKLALPGLNGVNLAAGEADLYAETLAQKFAARGVDMLTARDVQAVLGVERQKQLMGCGEEQSCLVEMIGALGVDGVVVGDVGKLGNGYVVNLKVLSTKTGRPEALFNGQANSPEELRSVFDQASWEVAAQLSKALGRPELMPTSARPGVSASSSPSRKWLAAVPAVVAVGAAVAGGVLLGMASGTFSKLQMAGMGDEALSLRNAGQGQQTGAIVAFGVAGAAAVATVLMLVFISDGASVAPTAWVSPSGASFGLTGVW